MLRVMVKGTHQVSTGPRSQLTSSHGVCTTRTPLGMLANLLDFAFRNHSDRRFTQDERKDFSHVNPISSTLINVLKVKQFSADHNIR